MSLELIQIKLQASDPRYLTHHNKWYWVLDNHGIGYGQSISYNTEEEAIIKMLHGNVEWEHMYKPGTDQEDTR